MKDPVVESNCSRVEGETPEEVTSHRDLNHKKEATEGRRGGSMPGRRKRGAGPMKWEEAGPFKGLCPIFEHNEGGCKREWAGARSQRAFWAKGMNLDFSFFCLPWETIGGF